MAYTDYLDTVQKIYIGYYGRPADPIGQEYWAKQLDAQDGSLAAIIDAFGNSAEATTLFSGMSNAAKVNAIYQQCFDRDAEVGGLTYYTNALTAGTYTQASIMLNILNGATGDDATAVANKLAVANLYTAALDTTPEILAYDGTTAASSARTFLATVDSTDASLTAATAAVTESVASMVAGTTEEEAAGQTYTLTTGIDTMTGTNGNDIFISTASATTPTLTLADTINGGTGTDTLKIVTDLAAAIPSIVTTSVETYQIQNTANGTLAVSTLSTAPTAVNFVGGGNNTFTLSGVGTGTAIGLQTEAGQLTLTLSSVTGSADALTLNLNAAASTASVGAAGIETFNLATSGAASTLAALTGAQGSKLVVTGDKALTITADLVNTFTTIDASAATAAIKVGVATGGNVTITGGTGNDRFHVVGFDNNDTVNGGTGTDTLALDADITVLPTKLTSIEKVEFTAATTQDLSLVGNAITTFAYSLAAASVGATNNENTYQHIVSGATSGAFAATAALNGPADILNVELSNSDLTTLTATNYETVNLVSSVGLGTGTVTNTVTTLNNSAAADIFITGSTSLTITDAIGAQGTVDASAFTGKLSVVGSGSADVIKGGSGVDTIKGGVGADVLTGGAGADKFIVTTTAASTDSTIAAYDSITDWSGDVLRFAAAENVAGAATTAPVATASVSITAGKAAFAAADDTLAEKLVALAADDTNIANNEVVFFEHGSDTYVYGAGAVTTVAADQFLVKLVGVTGLTTITESTITAGDFTIA